MAFAHARHWVSTVFITLAALLLREAQAAVNFEDCCAEVPVSADIRPLQWDSCHSSYNSSETDPAKMYSVPIITTYAWCRRNCEKSGNFEISDTSQWLTPLAAWIIPASALLLLLPISEHLKSHKQLIERTRADKLMSHYVHNWLSPTLQYCHILGDPSSAFNGSLAQMVADWNLCMSMNRPNNKKRERDLILTVLLAEQADFMCEPTRNALELMAGSSRAREYSKTACRIVWSARKKFNTAVVLPVALYIGVAASVFYDAYQKLGDNGTSHSLAYGTWYNWVLLLSIFSNCFASHSNLDAVRSGMELIVRGVVENHGPKEFQDLGWDKQTEQTCLESYEMAAESLMRYPKMRPPMNPNPRELFGGSLECRGAPLYKRYWNSWYWVRWLHKNGVDISRPKEGIFSYDIFWVDWDSKKTNHWMNYLGAQVLSWLFVLYSCSCAAILSYTTPKVGLGCRSLNHILYASVALLNAVIRVLMDWLKETEHKRCYRIVTIIYHFFVWLNSVIVLIGGSMLQIAGIFNNCFCKAGVVDRGPNSLIPLSPNSYAHQYWAKKVWLRVAYGAYGGVAIIGLVVLFFRLHIAYVVRKGLH